MKFFDEMGKPKPTGHRSFDRFMRIATSADVIKPRYYGDPLDRYDLKVSLGVSFHAQPEYFERAFKNARQQMVDAVFGDLRQMIYEAVSAVIEGDRAAALEALDKLEKELKP